MKTTQDIKQEIKINFSYIVDNCQTIGDLQKLQEEVRRLNKEIEGGVKK